MGNDEYIKIFLKKHKFDGNIIVQSKNGNTWDDVVSIICNEKDISPSKEISIEDVQYDVLSDMPEDSINQWLDYCKESGDVSYKIWATEKISSYVPSNVDRQSTFDFKKEIEDSIDNVFSDFEEKYTNYQFGDEEETDD